jgi:integrase
MKLYKRGEIYWATMWDGRRQIRVSTRCTNAAEARDKALTLLAPALLDQSAEEMDALSQRAQAVHRKAQNLRAGEIKLADAWKRADYHGSKGQAKASTLREADMAWRCLTRFMAERKIYTISALTASACQNFIKSKRPHAAVVSYNYCRAILRALGDTRDLFGARPVYHPAVHREPLTPEQIEALFKKVDGTASNPESRHILDRFEFARFVRFLIYTGLRLGDAATMKMDMIDLKKQTISRQTAKTQRPILFPLHPALLQMITEAASEPDRIYLFPSLAALYQRDRHALTQRFARLLDSAGIKGLPGQYCTHCLRTTFASICAEQGVPLAVIQSWLAHASSMVTRIYARIEDLRVKREALAKFPTL